MYQGGKKHNEECPRLLIKDGHLVKAAHLNLEISISISIYISNFKLSDLLSHGWRVLGTTKYCRLLAWNNIILPFSEETVEDGLGH